MTKIPNCLPENLGVAAFQFPFQPFYHFVIVFSNKKLYMLTIFGRSRHISLKRGNHINLSHGNSVIQELFSVCFYYS